MFFKPKTASKDFQRSMLPHNRREVFADVVKLHWGKLFLLGLLALAFSLPLHIVAVMQDFYTMQLPVETAGDDLGQIILQWISNSNTTALIEILCLMFFAIGLAGMIRVIRQLAWEENMYFRYDFITGIKQNMTQMVLLALITGVVRFICNYILNLSMLITSGEVYSYLGIIPSVLLSVVCIPPAAYAVVCIAVYGNSFRQNIKIGFILYAHHTWKTLLAVICGLMIFIPQYIPTFYTIVIGRLVSSICIPFIMLGWVLFTFNGLDEKINPRFHPELIGKGVFPEMDETSHKISKKQKEGDVTDR